MNAVADKLPSACAILLIVCEALRLFHDLQPQGRIKSLSFPSRLPTLSIRQFPTQICVTHARVYGLRLNVVILQINVFQLL